MRMTGWLSSGVGTRLWCSLLTPPACAASAANMRSVSARAKVSTFTSSAGMHALQVGTRRIAHLGTVVGMEIARALDFVRQQHRAVMLTYRRDGSPAMSPIVCNVDADDLIAVSTRETAMKTHH